MDFQDVSHWQNNKLDRKNSARMGWSDVSISLSGPVVEDLRAHFVERWNFIYNEKYDVRKDMRYSRLTFTQNTSGTVPQQTSAAPPPASEPYQYRPPPTSTYTVAANPSSFQGYNGYSHQPGPQGRSPYFPPPPNSSREVGQIPEEQEAARGIGEYFATSDRHHQHRERYAEAAQTFEENMLGRFETGKQYLNGNEHYSILHGHPQDNGVSCQIARSCTNWSHGVPTEHSIADAYISVIENSRHFVYIENQFFITATSEAQKPVKNKIGAAIVERILRAARAGDKFKFIVCIPAIPGFAGDLKDDSSLGTRAIMEFQYNSINRGGYSIMEMVAQQGHDPTEYIRFYNLRNYDRINVGRSMRDAEQKSGVNYEDAREQHDEAIELPATESIGRHTHRPQYQQYQQATNNTNRQQRGHAVSWDTVSDCYMLGGKDIRDVPLQNGEFSEMHAFVSEELYIHSKVNNAERYKELSLT